MAAKPRNIDDFLAPLSVEKRAVLEKLQRTIQSAAPKAEEYINYGVPAFRLNKRLLMAFGAAARHCSFYPGAFPALSSFLCASMLHMMLDLPISATITSAGSREQSTRPLSRSISLKCSMNLLAVTGI